MCVFGLKRGSWVLSGETPRAYGPRFTGLVHVYLFGGDGGDTSQQVQCVLSFGSRGGGFAAAQATKRLLLEQASWQDTAVRPRPAEGRPERRAGGEGEQGPRTRAHDRVPRCHHAP